ncbi:hypothetical protein JJC00_22935 [Bradyrhizobium diazoefficiens]|uniref:hypothetical protein n=1 Tax=Bradyrhizobium diazoefficiens TaxID=1355477 RepID=UPI00190C4FC7|nr:hypothetical protein [Bradyrhizobium diazoefficiens]QQO31483.1 hypothetical protein JJC00_22935 [Bradyrhizobium diazoefficiens]
MTRRVHIPLKTIGDANVLPTYVALNGRSHPNASCAFVWRKFPVNRRLSEFGKSGRERQDPSAELERRDGLLRRDDHFAAQLDRMRGVAGRGLQRELADGVASRVARGPRLELCSCPENYGIRN